MSSASRARDQHAEWLAALDGDGPWLTVPALAQQLRGGLVPTTGEDNRWLKEAHTRWATAHPARAAQAQADWIRGVVTEWLDWDQHAQFQDLQQWSHTHTLDASRAITTSPSFALLPTDEAGAAGHRPVILGFTHPTGTPLTRRVGDGWPTTPIDRAVHALRAADVPIGLVTDGKWWALVWAPRQSTPGYALWSTDLLLDDELLRWAFHTLLSRHRSLGVAVPESLRGLFEKSQDSQEDITQNLSVQTRRAVELLVDAFSSADTGGGGAYLGRGTTGIRSVTDEEVYQAAVTAVMRLVFLLAAEERGLLPADDDFYNRAYGIGALAQRLIDRANRDGEDVLRETSTAFPQLLATSRVVHDGVRHPRLNLPGYGGSVFDPARFPWLEDAPNDPGIGPIGVDDRTMLHILRGLTRWEGRRLSYRTLDVEQIGYAYEGLLDHTALTAQEPVLAIRGKKEPEIPLSELESLAARGDKPLAEWLRKSADLTPAAIKKALAARQEPLDAADRQRLAAACDSDTVVTDRVAPWLALLRTDERTGLPLVINPGSLYVTASSARGDTGTHYTPKYLAEQVVTATLDGITHDPGPTTTLDTARWRVIHPEQILQLRVADIAMGSGAFLVAAVRHLADRLLQSLELTDRDTLTTAVLIDLWDQLHAPDPDRPDWQTGHRDDIQLAAQQIITSHTIYGVDVNPMAVEMAKLSMWLVTAAKNQPFSFLDHRLLTGDSLMGLHNVSQLENIHLKPERGSANYGRADGTMFDFTSTVTGAVARIAELRAQIDKQRVLDLRSVEEQERLFQEAEDLTADLALVADAITAASLAANHAAKGKAPDKLLDAKTGIIAEAIVKLFADDSAPEARTEARSSLQAQAEAWLAIGLPPGAFPRDPLHWPLVFPEAFTGQYHGFDAIIGNPPYLGGKKITPALGSEYRNYLAQLVADGRAGSADFAAYFLLRATALTSRRIGVLTTNSISEGATREVGLDHLVRRGWGIDRAVRSAPWPGSASLEYAEVHLDRRLPEDAPRILAGQAVPRIGSDLRVGSRIDWAPRVLAANGKTAFIGSLVNGSGFLMSEEEAQLMISEDIRNGDVLRPYLNGEDLNSSPSQSASRWVVNFHDWTEQRSRTYTLPFGKLERDVKPERKAKTNKPQLGRYWWRYERRAVGLYEAIQSLDRVIAITLLSSVVQPVRVPADQVFSHGLGVFASDSVSMLGLLSSQIHGEWVRKFASSLETRVRYTPTDVFETFPLPSSLPVIATQGQAVETLRSALMLSRAIGVTATYNLVNDESCMDRDVVVLREAHLQLDLAALEAYGWSDLDPGFGFFDTEQGIRYCMDRATTAEVLDRLLELNRERYEAEVAAGLGGGNGRKGGRSSAGPRGRGAEMGPAGEVQETLWADEEGTDG